MRMGPAEPATGEYTTGYVHDGASGSDKKIGVVGLVLYDMRRRGKVDWIGMVGTTGRKNSGLRAHLDSQIARGYKDMDVTTELFPADDVTYSPTEYMRAIDRMQPGDGITIFTPDDTHFDIALYAIRHKLHVLIAKPAVQSVAHHKILIQEARNHGVLVVIEFHKRFDPIYSDARERIRSLDLNAHHIDMHIWSLKGHARPVSVTASAAAGVATGAPYDCVAGTMDTITLLVTWENIASGNPGTAVYTASWAAPKAEVHSQQRFFYTGHKGEGYGHQSIEAWADACLAIKQGKSTSADFVGQLSTLEDTLTVTAVLEAGHKSLQRGGVPVPIDVDL
ncbi:hypothetical protein BASA83_004036 [Batrachochytrium salamandrivorans]|nr:hypothetical protein BASA83_004036 [Batrachochytrium salamandrivorans]